MDVIPILSTIILVSTLITLIVAVASYFVFRIKEKKKKNIPPAQKATKKQESTEKNEKTQKNLGAKSNEENITAVESEPEEEDEYESDSYEDYEEEEYEEEYAEEEEEEEELSAAQSAFLNSMQRVITNKDDPRDEDSSPRSRGSKKLRKFSVKKKNKPEQDDLDSSDANSMWK